MIAAERHPVEELADDFLSRHRRGERPSLAEYAAKYPELSDELGQFVQALLLLEGSPRTETVRQLGEYRLVRELGRGGMGVVYEAVQEPLGRRVALKVLAAEVANRPGLAERFRREARAAAGLHHTNIVPVYAVGAADGVPYFAMQYIDGRPLDVVLAIMRDGSADTDLPERTGSLAALGPYVWAAGVIRQIAGALDYAHRHGILHRDVKPGNILLEADGTAWVCDFGLARGADDEALTTSGDVVGTLRYLAPERFSGTAAASSDVYALGLTLFELAVGRPAFPAGGDRADLVRRVTAGEFAKPRAVDPRLQRDLETIILKATALAPRDRYVSAQALADDLDRFIGVRPVAARRLSAAGRLWRWTRREPWLAGSIATAFLALTIGLAVSAVQSQRANRLATDYLREWHRAEAAGRRAEENFRWAQDSMYTLLYDTADAGGEPDLGSTPRIMIVHALGRHRQLLKRIEADPAARLDTARAYRWVSILSKSKGELAEARSAAEQAVAIAAGLVVEDPQSFEVQRAHADALFQRGIVAKYGNRSADAVADFRAAEALWLALTAVASPPQYEDRVSLGTARYNLGQLAFSAGQRSEGEALVRQAIVDQQVAQELPNSGSTPEFNQMNWRRYLAEVLNKPQVTAAGIAELELAVQCAERLLERGVGRRLGSEAARTFNELGIALQWRAEDWPRAETAARRAVELQRQAVRGQPDYPHLRGHLAGHLHTLGRVLTDRGDRAAGRDCFAEAVTINRQVLALLPRNRVFRQYFGIQLYSLGRAEALLGRPDDAVNVARELSEVDSKEHNGILSYRAAMVYATLLAGVGSDTAKKDVYGAQALAALQRAAEFGYQNAANLESITLKPLHAREQFDFIRQQVRKNQSATTNRPTD